VSAILSIVTSGSSPIDASTQSRSVSEFPCRRGLPANARTFIGIDECLEIRGEKRLDSF